MKENDINLSVDAVNAICALCHKNGTYHYYAGTLTRVMNIILKQSEEIGISDTEAMSILRTLQCLREDIGFISGMGGMDDEESGDDIPEDMAVKVEALFDFPDIQQGDVKTHDPEAIPAE